MTQLFGTLTAKSVHTALGGVSPPTAIASGGDRHRTHRSNPVIVSPKQVATLYVAIAIALTGATAVMATVGVAQLDEATALQCRTHDWPVSAHSIHIDWCESNGYTTR